MRAHPSTLRGRGDTEPEARALAMYLAIREEEGHYVAEYEDGTNLANAHHVPLRARRLA